MDFSSRYLKNYTQENNNLNINDVKHIFKWNKSRNTVVVVISFYCKHIDTDFAGDLQIRQSTTGYIIFYGGGV